MDQASLSARPSHAIACPSQRHETTARQRAATKSDSHRIGPNRPERLLKRLFDLLAVITIIMLISPVLLLVAIGVWFTTGRPVIFGHERVGRHGNSFKCYKFRSMVPNADQVLKELLERDPEARAQWEREFKLKDDPRITRFGHFIRKTSLDELPQLWNVLRGDMSLVGPRPVVNKELDTYYGDASKHYLSVRPGLTGLWQVSGRNDVSYEQRVQMDRHYVDTWNLMRDMQIMWRTVGVVVWRKGAY